jgi:hypothetical protein
MTVGIGEERHPEIVIVHPGDQVRLVRERDAASGQLTDGERDVRAAEVDAALRSDRPFGFLQQEPNAGTIEKCQVAEAVLLRQAEHIAVERLGAVDVSDRKGDLPDMGQIDQHACLLAARSPGAIPGVFGSPAPTIASGCGCIYTVAKRS